MRLLLFLVLCTVASAAQISVVNNSADYPAFLEFVDADENVYQALRCEPHETVSVPFVDGATRLWVFDTVSWAQYGDAVDVVPGRDLTVIFAPEWPDPSFMQWSQPPIMADMFPFAVPEWVHANEGLAFLCGFFLMATVRIFRAALKWFRRAGTESFN